MTNSKTGRSVVVEGGGDCKTNNLVYAARCKICELIYVGETSEALKTRFSKHRYDAKKRPDNCELADHFHDSQHDFERDLEITILKAGFKSMEERKQYEDKYICLLGTLSPDGINGDCGNYAREMYNLHQNM